MTPEEPIMRIMTAVALCYGPETAHPSAVDVLTTQVFNAIRAAENDALERAAVYFEDSASNGPMGGICASVVRAFKHPEPKPSGDCCLGLSPEDCAKQPVGRCVAGR